MACLANTLLQRVKGYVEANSATVIHEDGEDKESVQHPFHVIVSEVRVTGTHLEGQPILLVLEVPLANIDFENAVKAVRGEVVEQKKEVLDEVSP